jgi:hypothetical protein
MILEQDRVWMSNMVVKWLSGIYVSISSVFFQFSKQKASRIFRKIIENL